MLWRFCRQDARHDGLIERQFARGRSVVRLELRRGHSDEMHATDEAGHEHLQVRTLDTRR